MSVGVDLDEMQRRLEAERDRLQATIAGVNHDESLTEETGDLATGPGDHLADNATETYMRELDYGLEADAGRLLGEVEAALARISEGTYGVCAVCGRPIEPERLVALPYATLCIEDKRAQERG